MIEYLQQDFKLRIGWTRAEDCNITSRLAVFQRITDFRPDVATKWSVNRRLRRCSQFSPLCRWEANHTIITREACLAPRVRFEVLLVTVAEKHLISVWSRQHVACQLKIVFVAQDCPTSVVRGFVMTSSNGLLLLIGFSRFWCMMMHVYILLAGPRW